MIAQTVSGHCRDCSQIPPPATADAVFDGCTAHSLESGHFCDGYDHLILVKGLDLSRLRRV